MAKFEILIGTLIGTNGLIYGLASSFVELGWCRVINWTTYWWVAHKILETAKSPNSLIGIWALDFRLGLGLGLVNKGHWSQTSALTLNRWTLLDMANSLLCSIWSSIKHKMRKWLSESISIPYLLLIQSKPTKSIKTLIKGVNQKYTVFLFKYCQLMPFIDIRLQWYKVIDYLGVAKSFCLIKNKWHTICPKPPRHWLSWF